MTPRLKEFHEGLTTKKESWLSHYSFFAEISQKLQFDIIKNWKKIRSRFFFSCKRLMKLFLTRGHRVQTVKRFRIYRWKCDFPISEDLMMTSSQKSADVSKPMMQSWFFFSNPHHMDHSTSVPSNFASVPLEVCFLLGGGKFCPPPSV